MGTIHICLDVVSQLVWGGQWKMSRNQNISENHGGLPSGSHSISSDNVDSLLKPRHPRLPYLQGLVYLCIFLLVFILTACSDKKEMPEDFQENQPAGFKLTEITDGYRSLDDAYNNIDSQGVNVRLRDSIDYTESDFEISSYGFADAIDAADVPIPDLVRKDVQKIVHQLVDPSPKHNEGTITRGVFEDGSDQMLKDFYAFLDSLDSDGVEVPDDYLSGIIDKIVYYIIDEIPTNANREPDKEWLKDQMDDLIDDLQDPDFRDDFTDITKLLTKLLIQTNSSMWVDESGNLLYPDEIDTSLADAEGNPLHHSLSMGNAVQGTRDLIQWLNPIVQNEETRSLLHELILGAANILDPSPETELALKLRTLIENIEDHFTIGGAVYEADPMYSEDSAERYSDSELGQLVRDASPLLQQLFVRSDRPQAIIQTDQDEEPVYPLDLMAANLRSIGFNPDTIDVERSIDDLLNHDIWGRDRRTDAQAWPTSILESLLFLTQLTASHGWKDSGELVFNYSPVDSREDHSHGEYAEELTLNDSLFSIRINRTGGLFGVYELAFEPTNGNHMYRTRTPFTLSQVDGWHDVNATDDITRDDVDYRFFYDRNYGVLQFLAGPGAGDLGAPDGGNPDGTALGMNEYKAYAPNGLHETQLAGWTMGWGVRACFNGEGPYYYADPNAEVVTVDGIAYSKYLRPNGKVYALVSGDGQYLYPVDEGDTADTDPETPLINGQPQRDNRYKSQWYSDHFIVHYSHDEADSSEDHFFTIDNSSGKTEIREITDPGESAGRLTYNELVDENEPLRACASPEEAFFRNFQWVMNEKKMVLILPMYMDAGGLKAATFQIQECNGWAGLGNLRRFRDNHVWAKQGTDGISTIPGDYRFEVVSAPDEGQEDLLGAEAIYNSSIDCGNATPSVVGHNLPALYRLAFPRSIDPTGTFEDKVLGSKEFAVGDTNWENRNAFTPILFSLLAGMRDHAPAYDPDNKPGINAGMRTFLNQIAIWIKPLFYYNHADPYAETLNPGTQNPYNSWIPRVYGIYDLDGDGIDDRPVVTGLYVHQGAPFLTSSADFYATSKLTTGTAPNYYGDEAEQRFYQPLPVKSLLNILIDSDLSDAETRCDGILPLVTRTRTLTNFFKLILQPSVAAPPLEQIVTAMKFSKGTMTAINESEASGKGMDYPEWMFAASAREDDILLDEILDFVIGQDALDANGDGSYDADERGDGLAAYPDCRVENTGDPIPDACPAYADEYNQRQAYDRSWEEFNDLVETLADLVYEDSPVSISSNLLHIIDRIFARDQLYTAKEIEGLLYSVGKLFGHYVPDTGQWVYQGQEDGDLNDMYNMLVLRVPLINSAVVRSEVTPEIAAAKGGAAAGAYGYGDHYYSQLQYLAKLTGPDGLVEFLLNTVTVTQKWGEVLEDLDDFLTNSPDIYDRYSQLWPTLVQLLQDMGSAVGSTMNSDSVNDVVTDYGFQVN